MPRMQQITKTHRSPKYLAFIRRQPCVVSGSSPSVPHHTSKAGMALKGSDYLTVPLTPELHSELHTIGQESFQRKYNVDFSVCITRLLSAYVNRLEGNN
ncbi:MAG: hypothetical protein A4E60_00185 [Syntrophorhabdus sp. PtaB.Bin047]|nr:MAG: hypothetical protein A4E60_00185 [Syntrophorhabdus sp. PtaB.Bin047]